MTVEKCYPGRAMVVFSSEAKDFSMGGGMMVFFPIENTKTTFFTSLCAYSIVNAREVMSWLAFTFNFSSHVICVNVVNSISF